LLDVTIMTQLFGAKNILLEVIWLGSIMIITISNKDEQDLQIIKHK